MRTFVSLPEGAEGYFRQLYPSPDITIGHDPDGRNVGSGGAVKYLLRDYDFSRGGACIVINAGGEGRRLPAYNGYGKVLLPLPVAKWSRGQRIDQRLFELQRDYLGRLAGKAPREIAAVIAGGDVLLTLPDSLPKMPEADVILVGLWAEAPVMQKHGVFLCAPEDPRYFEGMIQKPDAATLDRLGKNYLTLLDSGVWLLSRKALDYLYTLSDPVDLYTDLFPFPDELKVAVYPIEEGEFYHFGTSEDLLESTLRYQNRFRNQRRLLSRRWKLHAPAFVQNTLLGKKLSEETNRYVWIENSYIPASWTLSSRHILTGIPPNDLSLTLPEGLCIDVVPLKGEEGFALKAYHYGDTFKDGTFMGRRIETDPYDAPLFPRMKSIGELPGLLRMMQDGTAPGRYSLRELPRLTDWDAVEAGRRRLYEEGLRLMQHNWDRSVFYHSDLLSSSKSFPLSPEPLPDDAPHTIRMQDAAFRAELGLGDREEASRLLASSLREAAETTRPKPYRNIFPDQLIWSRSPVRIDLAGGWSDTPPYCTFEGGTVVNLAVTLNGQEPVQAFVKPSESDSIVIRSIDLGDSETVTSLEELRDYARVGSPFSIPKAALVLCGVGEEERPWPELIDSIGGGLEVTLFSAVPAGSGLGTSSILGATVLAALSEYFGLGWDKADICRRTLLLEQMLTTGGGWQDQWGGIYNGAKLLTTGGGLLQTPVIRWLPEQIFQDNGCQVLFYTGIRRRAKDILSRIKYKMMLNDHATLTLLHLVKALAAEMAEAISKSDYPRMGALLRESRLANISLDPGSTTPEIEAMVRDIDDLALGYKMPGAGGGGFLYILAKDPEAALLIRERLGEKSRGSARLVDMSISPYGNRTTRS